jgi:hypothetical protein
MALDLFLWEYVKDYVCRTSVGDNGNFCAWIIQGMFTHTCAEMAYWTEMIRVSSHVKVE